MDSKNNKNNKNSKNNRNLRGVLVLLACYGLGSLLLWRLPTISFFKSRMSKV